MKIEAKDLQSALIEASKNLQCSVIDLEYQVLQHSKAGFLGFGRKNAIIEVCVKKRTSNRAFKKDFSVNKSFEKPVYKNTQNFKKEAETKNTFQNKQRYAVKNDEIFDNFYKESRVNSDILEEIRINLENLLENSCFSIAVVELKMLNENCVFIHLDGEDAALMIGKEAHRYKAFSYLLHNWISAKYNLSIRLEIAQFLENQKQYLQEYIQTISHKIRVQGYGQTKHFDGVLIKIALEQLRIEFPNKYVGIKQNGEQRFIIVNDFYKKDE